MAAKKKYSKFDVIAGAVLKPGRIARKLNKLEKKLADAEAQQRKNIQEERELLDAYVTDLPGHELAFRLFEGEWSSAIPGYGLGTSGLFDDGRITWFGEQCGGFQGKRVLELGPLEGGHTWMMAKAGATDITAIESNARAFLKCLIVQNALKFTANFLLGDFRPYLKQCTERYDLVVASGVLYHMLDPIKLLTSIAKVTPSIGLWTHYYDEGFFDRTPKAREKFEPEPRMERIGDREFTMYKYKYLDAVHWKGFCGGTAPFAYWLTRDSLLAALDSLGFAVTIGEENREHPNGSCLTLFATRRPDAPRSEVSAT